MQNPVPCWVHVACAHLCWTLLLPGGRHYNSEDFNTAGRTIKTGLIAVDVVSHWSAQPLPVPHLV